MSSGGWDYDDREPGAEILDLRPGVGVVPRPGQDNPPGNMEPIDNGILPDHQLATDYAEDPSDEPHARPATAGRSTSRRARAPRRAAAVAIAASVGVGLWTAGIVGQSTPRAQQTRAASTQRTAPSVWFSAAASKPAGDAARARKAGRHQPARSRHHEKHVAHKPSVETVVAVHYTPPTSTPAETPTVAGHGPASPPAEASAASAQTSSQPAGPTGFGHVVGDSCNPQCR